MELLLEPSSNAVDDDVDIRAVIARMTSDDPYTTHELNRLDNRVRYVAISRSTKGDFINVILFYFKSTTNE